MPELTRTPLTDTPATGNWQKLINSVSLTSGNGAATTAINIPGAVGWLIWVTVGTISAGNLCVIADPPDGSGGFVVQLFTTYTNNQSPSAGDRFYELVAASSNNSFKTLPPGFRFRVFSAAGDTTGVSLSIAPIFRR